MRLQEIIAENNANNSVNEQTVQPDTLIRKILSREAELIKLLQESMQECAELQHIFDMRWEADMRAIKDWQAITGRDMTWPDHADLCVFLLLNLDMKTQQLEKQQAAL